MIKDIFTLKKDSWHVKLMNYIWNLNHNDFSHICPYFWLSVFNVLIIIPVFIIKSFIKLLVVGFNFIDDIIDRAIENDMKKQIDSLKKNPGSINRVMKLCDKKFYKFMHRLNYSADRDLYYELQEKRGQYEQEKDERKQQQDREYEKSSIARKEKINRILVFIKPISIVFLWIVGLVIATVVACGIYLLVLLLMDVSSKDWYTFGKFCLYGLGILISLVTVIIIFVQITKYYESRCYCSGDSKVLKTIGFPFVWIVTGIVLIFTFLIQMIKNNCPGIDWE